MSLRTRETQCATCPFRDEGWAYLRGLLTERAFQTTPICHSTGPDALVETKQLEELACHGARLLQARFFHRIGFLEEPTIEAWDAKCQELGC
jgi:hypothetical protein